MLTASSDAEEVDFISRMFAPAAGVPEGTQESFPFQHALCSLTEIMIDPVCASAHCVMTPYWTQKLSLDSKDPPKPMRAKQVSARGGDLVVQWDRRSSVVNITGSVIQWATGHISI